MLSSETLRGSKSNGEFIPTPTANRGFHFERQK